MEDTTFHSFPTVTKTRIIKWWIDMIKKRTLEVKSKSMHFVGFKGPTISYSIPTLFDNNIFNWYYMDER